MHIVQALVSFNLGGSELVATELSEYAASKGHRVSVIAADGPLGNRVRTCGAEHIDWPIGKKRPGTLRYISRLSEWLERERPDILHVHSRLPAWICRLAIRRLPPTARPIFITSMHGHYSVSRYSAVMASGDRVIAVSDHIRQYTLHNYPATVAGRVVTVLGGVSHQIFPYGYRPGPDWHEQIYAEFPELANRRLLCLPGRLSRWKGHADFIELTAALLLDFPDLHGIIVGLQNPDRAIATNSKDWRSATECLTVSPLPGPGWISGLAGSLGNRLQPEQRPARSFWQNHPRIIASCCTGNRLEPRRCARSAGRSIPPRGRDTRQPQGAA